MSPFPPASAMKLRSELALSLVTKLAAVVARSVSNSAKILLVPPPALVAAPVATISTTPDVNDKALFDPSASEPIVSVITLTALAEPVTVIA